MELPNLARIIETHVPVRSLDQVPYYAQLREDVAPQLRALQASGSLRWYSFLMHTTQQLTPPRDAEGYIVHLRLEPAAHLANETFIDLLPHHFLDPHPVPPLADIFPVPMSSLRDGDRAYAWKVLGECSEWILELLDAYETGPEPGEVVQYLHFMTNPLLLGHQSVFLPHSQTY